MKPFSRNPAIATAVAAILCASVTRAADVNCTFACKEDAYPDFYRPTFPCPDIIINSQADADAWGSCGNVSGSVVVQNNDLSNLSLNGLQSISFGYLQVSNCSLLTGLSAPDLHYIDGGGIILSNLQSFTSLDLPVLQSYAGLVLNALPALKDFAIFKDGSNENLGPVTSIYGNFSIVNTALNEINFYSVYWQNLANLQISGNPELVTMNLSLLRNADDVYIAGNGVLNGPGPSLYAPDLKITLGMSISDVASIDLSSLYYSNDLTFSSNSFSLLSLPELNQVEQSFYIVNNPELSEVDIGIEFIGQFDTSIDEVDTSIPVSLVVSNNSKLAIINMPTLGTVAGNVTLSGALVNVTLNDLILPQNFTINSTHPDFDCRPFDQIRDSQPCYTDSEFYPCTNYTYTCASYTGVNGKDTALHYHAPRKHSLSSGAKGGIAAAVIVAVISIVLGGLWHKKRHPRSKRQATERVAENVYLEDIAGGVSREAGDDEEDLPKYARVEISGEVLPDYDVSPNSSPEREVTEHEASLRHDNGVASI